MKARLKQFFEHEATAGVIMVLMAALAMICTNSDLAESYYSILNIDLFGHYSVASAISDMLMPLFFLLVGLELKEEMQPGGALATKAQRTLPLIAALGGIVLPALIYLGVTGNDPSLQSGWAIPTATDIAFAICIVNLAGRRVPIAAKVFLLAIAIYDDLAAIAIIALFYAGSFNALMAILALGLAYVMFACRHNERSTSLVLGLGLLLAYLLHEAGIHTTVAGMITGICIPTASRAQVIHRLDPWVSFGILPIFALANAGVPLGQITLETLQQPLPLGILLGLFIGKQVGIFATTYAAIKLGYAPMLKNTSWLTIYGIAVTAGIGFTMSLFVTQLAFPAMAERELATLGVLTGSFVSALLGWFLLMRNRP